jgi:hypothetical protein
MINGDEHTLEDVAQIDFQTAAGVVFFSGLERTVGFVVANVGVIDIDGDVVTRVRTHE